MKRCCTCKKQKKKDEFHKNNSSKDGYHWVCKLCHNKKQRGLYKNNPELRARVLATSKKNYHKNIEHHHKQKREYYVSKYTEIFRLLGEVCVRCGEDDKRVLHIDHIHGGGGKHRKRQNYSWWRYCADVLSSIKQNKKEYQLLCANCNRIESVEKGYHKSIWS